VRTVHNGWCRFLVFVQRLCNGPLLGTAPKWAGHEQLTDPYQRVFRAALQKHFPGLREFQQKVALSTHALGGRKPVGRDLCNLPSRHLFIEVKLPGDRVANHQLAGLAVILRDLRGDKPVSVRSITLYSARCLNAMRRLRAAERVVAR
jgi:hypothetical protein